MTNRLEQLLKMATFNPLVPEIKACSELQKIGI